jgi:hypothetical protein
MSDLRRPVLPSEKINELGLALLADDLLGRVSLLLRHGPPLDLTPTLSHEPDLYMRAGHALNREADGSVRSEQYRDEVPPEVEAWFRQLATQKFPPIRD